MSVAYVTEPDSAEFDFWYEEAAEAAARALYLFDNRHETTAQMLPFEALNEAERFAYRRQAAVGLSAAAAVIERRNPTIVGGQTRPAWAALPVVISGLSGQGDVSTS